MSREDPGVRLQKAIADAGVASRRAAEDLIARGRVEVDGRVVSRLGTRVDPATAVIRVNGQRVPPASPHIYLALNKPVGVVSTMSDPDGRPTLAELLADRRERLFHVGRLDADTEGLLLLTNHGDLAHRVAHPSYVVPKTYLAEVSGRVPARLAGQLASGVLLEDGPVAVDRFRVLQSAAGRSLVELELHEGRNRVVRRLLDAVGHPVRRLSRTAVGPVRLGRLPAGSTRELTATELGRLLDAVGL